jgi:hypothetical protein
MAHPIVRAGVHIFSWVVVLIAALATYAAYSENKAERSAIEFCASVRVGEDTETLLAKAKASGADEQQTRWITLTGEDPWLPVTFTGATPLSRHICSIKAKGTIKSLHYVYLD